MTHRYYDPGTGKFISRDPIGYAGGENLYGFCGGNPVNESDPSGYIVQPPTDKKGRIAYYKARTFLMRNPIMKKVIVALEKSKKHYQISTDTDVIDDVSFDFSNNYIMPTILWATNQALAIKDANGALTGGSISPALTLGHELLHAYHYDLSPAYVARLLSVPDAQYDNLEEKRTVATERILAKFFHQSLRYNHDGEGQTVDGPLQRPQNAPIIP